MPSFPYTPIITDERGAESWSKTSKEEITYLMYKLGSSETPEQWICSLNSTRQKTFMCRPTQEDIEAGAEDREYRFSVDLYNTHTKGVVEYFGCYMHSCPKHCRGDGHGPHGVKHYENYERGQRRLKMLRNHPEISQVIVVWGCEFDFKAEETQEIIDNYISEHGSPKVIDRREAFRGKGEQIKGHTHVYHNDSYHFRRHHRMLRC